MITTPKKIVVVGVSASGKSSFARKLQQKTGLPLHLMDAIMWRPDWNYIGDEATSREIQKISVESEWIIEGYITKASRPDLFERADRILYLDYSPWVSASRYIRRWWRHRKDARPEIPGCPEKFSFKFLKLVWTKGEAITLERYLKEVSPQEKIVRFRKPAEAESYLNSLRTGI